MKVSSFLVAAAFSLVAVSGVAFAQEKKGTISSYDESSRMVVIKGKDWEEKAKIGSKDAEAKKDLLKDGTKVTVEFDDRGSGDVRVKNISPR